MKPSTAEMFGLRSVQIETANGRPEALVLSFIPPNTGEVVTFEMDGALLVSYLTGKLDPPTRARFTKYVATDVQERLVTRRGRRRLGATWTDLPGQTARPKE